MAKTKTKTKTKYSLVGVDGNAYSIMAYVQSAMEDVGFSKKDITAYQYDAMSGDYTHLLGVSVSFIHVCNEKV